MLASAGDWALSLWINAHTSNTCGYHMRYGGNDNFYVHASGYIYQQGQYLGSDVSFKKDITTISNALNKVLQLRGVTYQLNYSDSNSIFNDGELKMGLIAQEVQPIVPEVVKTMPNGTEAIAYQNLVGLLIEAIKEQQTQIQALNDLINCGEKTKNQKSLNNTPSQSNTDSLNAIQENNLFERVVLYQNAPNPFHEKTIIRCYLPQNIVQAKICIYNIHGELVKCISIPDRKDASLKINGKSLNAGIYAYVLIADGTASETKQMILTK